MLTTGVRVQVPPRALKSESSNLTAPISFYLSNNYKNGKACLFSFFEEDSALLTHYSELEGWSADQAQKQMFAVLRNLSYC